MWGALGRRIAHDDDFRLTVFQRERRHEAHDQPEQIRVLVETKAGPGFLLKTRTWFLKNGWRPVRVKSREVKENGVPRQGIRVTRIFGDAQLGWIEST